LAPRHIEVEENHFEMLLPGLQMPTFKMGLIDAVDEAVDVWVIGPGVNVQGP